MERAWLYGVLSEEMYHVKPRNPAGFTEAVPVTAGVGAGRAPSGCCSVLALTDILHQWHSHASVSWTAEKAAGTVQ